MHRITISGYYGFNNVGDESILTSIVSNLKKQIKDIHITVLSANPSATSEKHQIHSIDRKNIKEIYRSIKECDVFISGGGSLLQDVTSHRSITYYLIIMFIAILLGKKVLIYSQGIGPINRKINRYLTQWILNKVDEITVRDEKSKEELLNMGVTNPSIYVTADPVINLPKGDLKLGEKILKKEGLIDVEKKPLIGFAMRGWKNDEKFNNIIGKTADKLIEDFGVEVVFIPFHLGEDMKIIEDIQKNMKNQAIFIKNRYDINEMLGIIGNLQMLVGVRLHSLIFAAIMKVPMIAISYDPKINSFMELLGLKVLCSVEDLEYEDLLLEIERKQKILCKEQEVIMNEVNNLQKKLEKNEELVMKLLQHREGKNER